MVIDGYHVAIAMYYISFSNDYSMELSVLIQMQQKTYTQSTTLLHTYLISVIANMQVQIELLHSFYSLSLLCVLKIHHFHSITST